MRLWEEPPTLAQVPGRGLEPLLLAEPDPKSGASANFATPALLRSAVAPWLALARENADSTRAALGGG